MLIAAADLIRDLAAQTTKPRPNGHGWSVPGEEDGWEPDWAAMVTCAGYGGEDVVACDVRVGDGRWIAALSPALAPGLETMLREYARCVAELGYQVETSADGQAMLTIARSILGSGVDTP